MALIGNREFSLSHVVEQKLELALKLAHKIDTYAKKIVGIQKVEKKIAAEKVFLEATLVKVTSCPSEVKEQHVLSSNLPHLEALLLACDHAPGVSAVLQNFWYTRRGGCGSDGCGDGSVLVDVVAGEGSCWVKVFARKRSALHLCWLGGDQGSDRPVTVLAQDFVEAGNQNHCRYEAPQIIFAFFDGITESIAGELCALGVAVCGPVFSDDSAAEAPSYEEVAATLSHTPMKKSLCENCEIINLDVSTLVAWSSLMIRGGAQYKYESPILEQQAAEERATPLLPQLEALTTGRKLIVCRTAFESFTSILGTVGGPREKEIGSNLLRTVEVVADSPSERALKLRCTGKIKDRSKVVFGTGDSMRATTLTANEGFVRAVTNQGVLFDVVIHASKALSEMQQPKS